MIGSQIERFDTFFIKFSTSRQNKEKPYGFFGMTVQNTTWCVLV